MATKFKDFMREIEDEARAEGPEAMAELEALRTHFRLGRQIAGARRTQSLSQAQVAKRAGIDQADVSDIERGASNPTLNKLEALLGAVGLELTVAKRRRPRLAQAPKRRPSGRRPHAPRAG